jgi:hypothetical protein
MVPLFVWEFVVQEVSEPVVSVGQGARYGAAGDAEYLGDLGLS